MSSLPSEPLPLFEAMKSGIIPFEPWPMQRRKLEAFERCPENVWCEGRRSAKTTTGAVGLLWMATCRPDLRQYVKPHEPVYAVSIANNKRQAMVALGQIRGLIKRSRTLRRAVVRETDEEIHLDNGVIVAAFVCSARTVRGFPIIACLLDEFAFFLNDTDGPQAAQEVFAAVIPGLFQFGDERRLIVSSTPNGPNLFASKLEDAKAAQARGDESVAWSRAARKRAMERLAGAFTV